MTKDKDTEIEKKQEGTISLISQAIAKGSNLDELGKLLALKKEFEADEARKAYHRAMTEFKANPPKIDKDKTVQYKEVKYNHASLYNVTEKINAELAKHGLSASWSIRQNGQVCVTCKITHKQGHSEETTLQAPADTTGSKNSIQAIGSTISYLQRYSLLALTGLATCDQDDDSVSVGVEYITDEQQHEIADLIAKAGANQSKVLAFAKAESLDKITRSVFPQLILTLDKMVKKAGQK